MFSNGQRLLAWATAYQYNWLTFSKTFVLLKRACMNTMSKLKRETVQRKIWSRNKTNLMTEKITFFFFKDKKLKFQSSRCGVSPGFEKRVMCRGDLYNKKNYLYYFLFMLHILYVHTGHIGIHAYKTRGVQPLRHVCVLVHSSSQHRPLAAYKNQTHFTS